MTGAVMRETETLYSALGKEGRMGDGGSEWGRNVSGGWLPRSLSLPHTPPCLSLSLHPPFPPSNPQRCTLAWNMGARTHSSLRECVFVYVDLWNDRAEASNRQTCMWGCRGYSIPVHLCFYFSLTLTFLLFFITVIFSFYLSILVLSTKIILSVVLFLLPLPSSSLSLTVFSSFFLLTSTLVHLSLSLHLSLPHHLRACFGYERSWNSRAQI